MLYFNTLHVSEYLVLRWKFITIYTSQQIISKNLNAIVLAGVPMEDRRFTFFLKP